MVMHVALTHETSYRYDKAVKLGPQIVRLRPAPHCPARVLSYTMRIFPEEHFLNWQQDPQSNFIARILVPEKTPSFKISVDLVVEMAVVNPFDYFLEPHAEKFPFAYEPWLAGDLAPYLITETPGPRLRTWLDSVSRESMETNDFLVALNARLKDDIGYIVRMETGIQSCEETLELARGSCRDSGWLLVQILRHLGLAARFVSGYLIQLKPDVKSLDGPTGAEEDFTDLHAWAEVYLPGAGWVGLDPTSGLFAGEGHIPLACTPDPGSAAPISGITEEAEVDFSFSMGVKRIFETPRVTKPYSEDQWRAIDALGKRIADLLARSDVRLTMGGEPTFVSIDDMEGEEWTTDAVGPTKRELAATLIGRLRDRYAPGGLLHFGQGKWYPGESLPRWSFSLYWRSDGQVLWRDPELIAGEVSGGDPSVAEAEEFTQALAETLDIDRDYIMPAFEDPLPHLGQEQQLPENVDVFDSKLEDPERRARIVRVFERGLDQPVGFALPLQRWNAKDERRWRSEKWSFRRKRLFLTPGDSPLGFRLPLESLHHVSPEAYPFYIPADPFAARSPLAPPAARRRQRAAIAPPGPDPRQAPQRLVEQGSPGGDGMAVRTALSVESRDGRLSVFLPPTESAEDYVELVTAIEDTAVALDQRVNLEGYTPPKDDRLNVIRVTPDPGVIEVNIHPAGNWDELVENTVGLYEDARLSRLGTEKFMLDGRHTGTGGGNHVVVGGPTPADSPFLRRPDLLRSLITFWQNHPSLSYLFSGLFIGPTSQAPRVDEARDNALYELELAFSQIPEPGTECAPWLVDRILRNLLIDVSGNTHRSEICIDKLYSPDGPTGRLGLVEFRAFEMPPHARMSLVQQLLLRALIARFWRQPYQQPLVRWNTQLHDRFMLPNFVWQDFRDVMRNMREAGFALEEAWFLPHFEFRFPIYGSVTHSGVEIELRQALEPWHVMGEENAPGGTARYVDSSLERLQVRVTGMTGDRHIVTCNGKRVPLQATETNGEFVASVRFRAWKPPSCLHPTIDTDAPLIFDLFDTWSGRAIGGCAYNVAHPGGRGYEVFPVNAYEAESRRLSRFSNFGHTPGETTIPPLETNPQFPHTLDLRRA